MDKLTAWIRYKGAFHLLELAYKSSSIAKRIPLFVRVIQPDQSIHKWQARQWWVIGKYLTKNLTLLGKRLEACKDFASFDPKLIRTSSEGSQAASKSRTMFKNYSTGIFLI